MLLKLPLEVLLDILANVDPENLLFGVGSCCRQLREVCAANSLWQRALGLSFFHDLGLLREDVEAIPSIRNWYLDLLKKESHALCYLDQFLKTEDPNDALEVVTHRCMCKRALENRYNNPKTLKDHYWARWFADVASQLEGIYTLFHKPANTFDRPLDACIAVAMVGEQDFRGEVLDIIDDPVWAGNAFFMSPLERVDMIIAQIDATPSARAMTMITKASLFIEIASQHRLLTATLVSFGDPTTSTYACVFFESGQCFIDFSHEKGMVRTTQEIGGRVDFLGAQNVRAGLAFGDILRDEAVMFNAVLPDQTEPQDPKQLPHLFTDFLMECFDPRSFRHLFKKLVSSVVGGQVTIVHNPAVPGNYMDLLGRIRMVHSAPCVVLSAHDDRCVVLDKDRIVMVPPDLLEDAPPLEIAPHDRFKLVVPQIEGLCLERLGECFQRWSGDKFV